MSMSDSREEEKRGLLRSSREDDTESMHSFDSAPTLTPSLLSPALEDEKQFPLLSPSSPNFDIENEKPIFAASAAQLQRQSWRKTPLTIRGISLLLLRIFKAALLPLLPSPLHPFLTKQPRTQRKIHPTSYLDGLRGVAALLVLHSHFLTNWFYPLRSGYLNSVSDTYIMQLPILRLFYAGRASVAVFFVISGFVLSYKPLLLLRQGGEKAKVLEVLGSSVFRRGVRLWVPIVLGTLISALLANKDLYTPVPGRGELLPPVLPTLREQLWHWYGDLWGFSFPWKSGGVDGNGAAGFAYNGHLWTIPIEFYGSIVVFVTVLGLSGVNRGNGWMRMLLGMGLVHWSLRGGRWDVSLFLGGMVCAEWSLICSSPSSQTLPLHLDFSSSSPSFSQPHTALSSLFRISRKSVAVISTISRPIIRRMRVFNGPINIVLLFTSLFLLSYAGESASPGHYHDFLVPHTPAIWEGVFLGREHFWLCLGALMLLFSLSNSKLLQSPFTWAFPQYLGDISYALYIVHGMVLFTLGTHLQEKWTGQVGRNERVDNGEGELVEAIIRADCTDKAWWMGLFGCAVINWVVVFWCADLFWRAVDGRTVGWGRWAEGLVSGRRRR